MSVPAELDTDPSAERDDASGVALPRRSWKTRLEHALRQGGLVIALILLVIIFSALYPGFFSTGNALNILLESSVTAIAAIGQTLVIMTAGIDLSVGSVLAFSSVLAALLMEHGFPVWPAVVIGVLAGAAAGAVNGLLVVATRVSPFMVTLGTMSIFSGVGLVLSDGRPIYNLPTSLTTPLTDNLAGVPVPVWIMIALTALFSVVVRYTPLGEYALAIGGNEEAVRVSGVPLARYKIAVYALAGSLAAVAGIVTTARLGTADPTAGSDLLLTSVAAAVMGGASLLGGEGSVFGAVVGAIVITTLEVGLTLLGVAIFYQSIAVGAVVIVVVTLDQFARRSSGRGGLRAVLQALVSTTPRNPQEAEGPSSRQG